MGHNIFNPNLLQYMEASQTIKNPWCLLMGNTMTHDVSKIGRAVGKKKLTLYLRTVMSLQVLNYVLPGVFVREYMCVCQHMCVGVDWWVCVYMLIFIGHGCLVAVNFTTRFTKYAAWLKLACSISIMFLSQNVWQIVQSSLRKYAQVIRIRQQFENKDWIPPLCPQRLSHIIMNRCNFQRSLCSLRWQKPLFVAFPNSNTG